MKAVKIDSVIVLLPDTTLPDEYFYYGKRDIIVPVARKLSEKKLYKIHEFLSEIMRNSSYKEISKPVEDKICRILNIELYEEV
jgi:hypothetical protein